MAMPIPPWVQMLQHQDEEEEKFDVIPVKVLVPQGRTFVWWLCKHYNTLEGVPGQACSMFERFMSKKIRVLTDLQAGSEEFQVQKHQMMLRIPLLTSVCIALTTKMLNAERILYATTIRTTLARYGFFYTLPEINVGEMEVFSGLNFYMPLYTNVQKALMLAVEVGMEGDLLNGVSLITDVAEYYRAPLQDKIIYIACLMCPEQNIQRQEITNIRNIHFVAGVVVATSRFMKFQGPDPLPRLAYLTQCAKFYIKCIGYMINCQLEASCVPSRKRKHEDIDEFSF